MNILVWDIYLKELFIKIFIYSIYQYICIFNYTSSLKNNGKHKIKLKLRVQLNLSPIKNNSNFKKKQIKKFFLRLLLNLR